MNTEELKNLTLKILEDTHVMSLGTVDNGGVWVADVTYIHDENFNLYWLSKPHVRHSKAIESNPKVACTITASWGKGKERALQIEGVAEKINESRFDLEQKMIVKEGLNMPKTPGEILKKGHVWYVLKPTKIELIHSEPFGFEKQILNI